MNKQNKHSYADKTRAFLGNAFRPADSEVAAVVAITVNDFRNAALAVSVFINAFVLTAWLVLEAVKQYN